MKPSLIPCLLALFLAPVLQAAEVAIPHQQQSVEGWTVQVDERLLQPAHAALGKSALVLLRTRLADITVALPPDKVQKLQKVSIWLDVTSGALTSMQYHPSADWLVAHGHSAQLAKAVHIPVAAGFVNARHQQVQPWSLLHELAHAYHDQVLGFDDARVLACWQNYVKSGHGEKVLFVTGKTVRHYALTNAKEYFAEMTEAYFGVNDFHPFVHGELKTAEPETYQLMRDIWGKTALD